MAVETHAAVNQLARARRITDDRVVTFEYMPRDAIAFVLKLVDGTRDPMPTAYNHYVLMELAAGEAAAAELRAMLEEVLGEGLEDGIVLDAVFAESGQQAADFWKIRETSLKPRNTKVQARNTISLSPFPGLRIFWSRRLPISKKWFPASGPAHSDMLATGTSTLT